MKDSVFGELSYDGGWIKRIILKLWGKDVEVKIRVSAYENEEPNVAQQNAYKRLNDNLEKISNTSLEELKKYMNTIKEDILAYSEVQSLPEDIFDLVSVSEIIFMESGLLGIMCSVKWDSHGIAILCKEHEVEVGPQDIVWTEE